MDTSKLQTSFIPNKNISGLSQDESGGSFVSVIGMTLFVVTVIASVGVYGYQKYLEGKIAGMDLQLQEARNSLDPDLIKKLTQTNDRFVSANELISRHQVSSAFLDLLSKVTLKTVQFTALTYETDKGGLVSVKMKGSARSYGTVAAQAKAMNDEPLLLSPQFSNLDLSKEGDVVFEFKAGVDKKTLSYEKKITDAGGGVPAPTPVATSTPVSSAVSTTTSVATTTSQTPTTPKKVISQTTTKTPVVTPPSSTQQ